MNPLAEREIVEHLMVALAGVPGDSEFAAGVNFCIGSEYLFCMIGFAIDLVLGYELQMTY